MKEDPQFCAYCGAGLVTAKEKTYYYQVYVYLKCPNYSEFRLRWWPPNPHSQIWIRTEPDETILNYDPITGEKINR